MSIVQITDTGLGRTFEVAVGDEIVLRLSENPTTGFRWQMSQSGDGALRSTGDRFEPGGSSPLPGASGHRVLAFAAVHAGAVTLTLVQRRLPEPPAGPSKQVTIIVR